MEGEPHELQPWPYAYKPATGYAPRYNGFQVHQPTGQRRLPFAMLHLTSIAICVPWKMLPTKCPTLSEDAFGGATSRLQVSRIDGPDRQFLS